MQEIDKNKSRECGHNNYLVSWFYAEKSDDESFYPQMQGKGSSSSSEFQKTYWRCIYCFYKSALLTNGGSLKYVFFTNVDEMPDDIDGVDMGRFFADNDIQVYKTELTKKTPADWFGAWRNQLYVFDILKCLGTLPEGAFLILDSDIIIRGNLSVVFDEIRRDGLICYSCGYNADHDINGISIRQMNDLYKLYYNATDQNVKYYGGEFVGAETKVINKIIDAFPELWASNYRRYAEKAPFKLNEEAHFLSIIYHRLGMANDNANKYIKRMWTAYQFDNIEKADSRLPLWHLPYEKTRGLERLFKYFIKHPDCDVRSYLRKSDHIFLLRSPRLMRKAQTLFYKAGWL